MTDTAALLELVGRLEARDAVPGWELDSAISWAISEWKNVGGGWREHKVTGERERFDYTRPDPKYTSSVDAALTLVPEGAWLDLSGPRRYLNIPSPSPNFWKAIIDIWTERGTHVGWGATPALALCIAALRARAA